MAWVLSCFRSPACVRTVLGFETADPGDCLLLDPGFPEWYTSVAGAESGYRNDWIQFEDASLPSPIQELRVPVNRLIPTGNPLLIQETLEEIDREFETRPPFWEAAISSQLRQLLLRMMRSWMSLQTDGSRSLSQTRYRDKFLEIRRTMRSGCSRRWTLRELSEMAHLSPSRFSVLYSQIFQVSPREDLIRWRVTHVAQRLLTSDSTLQSLAAECGFSDEAYLSRVFRKRMGCTPGAYRNTGWQRQEGPGGVSPTSGEGSLSGLADRKRELGG